MNVFCVICLLESTLLWQGRKMKSEKDLPEPKELKYNQTAWLALHTSEQWMLLDGNSMGSPVPTKQLKFSVPSQGLKRSSSAALQECQPRGCESPSPARKKSVEMRFVGTVWDPPWSSWGGRRGWGLALQEGLSVFQFLWERAGDMEPGLLRGTQDRARGNVCGNPRNPVSAQERFCWEGGEPQDQFAQRGCGASICGGTLSSLLCLPCAVPGDVQRPLPTSAVLWLCLRKCITALASHRSPSLISVWGSISGCVWQTLSKWCWLDVAVYMQAESVTHLFHI